MSGHDQPGERDDHHPAAIDADADPPILPVVVLALAARVAVILPQAPASPGMGTAFDQYALRIAAGFGFGPSSLLPPLYPYFLAMLYRVYGYSHHVVVLSQAVLGALAAIRALLLARAAGLRGWRLYAAGWMAALLPTAVAETRHLSPLLLVSALFGTGTWLWLRGRPLPGRLDTVLAGILLGAAVLGRTGVIVPLVLLALAVPSPPLIVRMTTPRAELWLHRGFLIAVAVLSIAPWAIRNSILHRRAVMTETTWALRLRMVTVPGTPVFRVSAATREARAPDNLVLADNGLAAWETLGYILTHPVAVGRTWGLRVLRFFSLGVASESAWNDPFPYRRAWFRVLHALVWGGMLTLCLAWLVLLRGAGGIERALVAAAAGFVLLGTLTAAVGDIRILAGPLLAVPAARGLEGLRQLRRATSARRSLFLMAAALVWIHGLVTA